MLCHPQAAGQTRLWLAEHLPGVAVLPATSNGKAAELAAQDTTGTRGGRSAPRIAGEVYKLKCWPTTSRTCAGNVTRFLVVARAASQGATGHDKTAVVFSIRDRVGALRDLAEAFASNDGQPVEHPVAAVEAAGVGLRVLHRAGRAHLGGARAARAGRKAEEHTVFFKVLGSWPSPTGHKPPDTAPFCDVRMTLLRPRDAFAPSRDAARDAPALKLAVWTLSELPPPRPLGAALVEAELADAWEERAYAGHWLVDCCGRHVRVVFPGRRWGGPGPDFRARCWRTRRHADPWRRGGARPGERLGRPPPRAGPGVPQVVLHVVQVADALALDGRGRHVPTVRAGRRRVRAAARRGAAAPCVRAAAAVLEVVEAAGRERFEARAARFEADLSDGRAGPGGVARGG